MNEDAHLEAAYEDRQSQETSDLLQPLTWQEIAETEALCPACGDWMDFCSGHGEIGDPVGWTILQQHEAGEHDDCFGGDYENQKSWCLGEDMDDE